MLIEKGNYTRQTKRFPVIFVFSKNEKNMHEYNKEQD